MGEIRLSQENIAEKKSRDFHTGIGLLRIWMSLEVVMVHFFSADSAPGLLAAWRDVFTVRPDPLTQEAKRAWIARTLRDTALGSDAFFPFGDNVERAFRSGVSAIVQPGGSIRDDHVIMTCNNHNIAMAFCGLRLFHH